MSDVEYLWMCVEDGCGWRGRYEDVGSDDVDDEFCPDCGGVVYQSEEVADGPGDGVSD